VVDSLFSFVLPLVVVSGGALLGERGGWFSALAAFVGYAVLLVLVHQGVLAPPGLDTTVRAATALRELFTHGSALLLTAGLMAYVLSQARTAGERAEAAESVLLQLHVLHDSIVRSIGSGILTTNRRGEINFVNRAGEEILGQRLAELRGRPLGEIFPSMPSGMEGVKTVRQEAEWRTPGGKKRLLGFAL